jgi:pimeloyl-ACP methyl ester carboxylesterase
LIALWHCACLDDVVIYLKHQSSIKLSFMQKLVGFLLLLLCAAMQPAKAQVKNIVIVHGTFADGSGWEAVYKILTGKGYHVSVVGNPTTSFAEDVKRTRAVLAEQTGPVILVGHSYGGAVISEAGDTANVVGLVFVAAFAPDAGESIFKLSQAGPPGAGTGVVVKDGLISYDKAKFHQDFCPDVPAEQARFMADAQVPAGVEAFATELTAAAWKTRKSWFIVSKEDRMISPDAERSMAKRANAIVTEVASSHVVFMSHPKEVVAVIEAAAVAQAK